MGISLKADEEEIKSVLGASDSLAFRMSIHPFIPDISKNLHCKKSEIRIVLSKIVICPKVLSGFRNLTK